MLYDVFLAPFIDYEFLLRALIASLVLSFGSAPLGVLLLLKRMSLVGDALSHAILPGVAFAFLFFGLSLPALVCGAFIAGICVVLLSGLATKKTRLPDDASFTGFYLISLALGILILSLKGGSLHTTSILFGSILAIDWTSFYFILVCITIELVILTIIYTPFLYDCFDATFSKTVGISSKLYQNLFLTLVVLNLVASYQTLGTLLALGMMMLPAITARMWCHKMSHIISLAIILSVISSYVGLLLSYHFNLSSGPTIILTCGFFYIFSVLFVKPHGKIHN